MGRTIYFVRIMTLALAFIAASFAHADVVISEFMADNSHTITNKLGKTSDWIEIFNNTGAATNLAGWHLTDNVGNLAKWTFPSTNLAAGKFLLVYASGSNGVIFGELHASFKLAKEGGYLALVRTNLTVAYAYTNYPPQDTDVSYGIGSGVSLQYFLIPTPGASNTVGLTNFVADTKFTPNRGLYTNAIAVTIATTTTAAQIYYTLDCSVPTTNSTLYAGSIPVTNSTVVRASAFKTGAFATDVDTHSYIFPRDALRQPAAPTGFPVNWTDKIGNVTPADYAMDTGIVNSVLYGPVMTQAVYALPFLSLSTANSNLFDAATGIYANPLETGSLWERAASAEYVRTNQTSGFGINCGLRIHGDTTRPFATTRKKAFSLRFRAQYGAGNLSCDLFDDPAAARSFNDLLVRGGGLDAWNNGYQHTQAQYLRNAFAAQLQRDMGNPAPHSTPTHVYLDGLYWGVYDISEKLTGDFAADYFGGSANNWDVFNSEWDQGDNTAFYALLGMVNAGTLTNAVYQKIQGNNPDRTRNPAYPVYFDAANYSDYVLLQMWYGNREWIDNNLCLMRNRDNATSTGFKWSVWDSEAGMTDNGDGGTNLDMTAQGDPTGLRGALFENAEFRLQFADRMQKHLFHGGALTAEAAAARYRELADRIEPALVAESARWGDQDGNAAHTLAEWRTERDWVLNTYLPQRGAVVLQQFRNIGVFPAIDAPEFNQYGGIFTNGFLLSMSAANAIYFTLDGSDPRQYGTGVAAGSLYTNAVALTRAVRVKARARLDTNTWSALAEAIFVPEQESTLRVTELMFHPRSPAGAETNLSYGEGDYEYIELRNTGSGAIGLAGTRISNGVTFDFTQGSVDTLAAGDYVLVVANRAAFTNRYPSVPGAKIAGEFQFPAQSLSDAGEAFDVVDGAGRVIASFTYNNAWFPAADGAGHSLVPLSMTQTNSVLNYWQNWRASAYRDGSPGADDPAPITDIVLNEVLAHTDPDNDWIEVYNTTASPVTFSGGWYLSDDADNLKKWQIPATGTIAAHGWRCWDEVTGFHTNLVAGFGLNKADDTVFLSYLPGTGQDRVADAVRLQGQENSKPSGRYPDGALYWQQLAPTPGASNQLAAAQEIVISEIMYHPAATANNPENNENDEFVELYNPSGSAVGLTNVNVDVGGAWRLSGGIAYTFPTNTVIPAGGYRVVVSFDPASDATALSRFQTAYGLTNGQIQLLGPFSGKLANEGDVVRLERPVFGDPPAPLEDISWHRIDTVTYSGQPPWPANGQATGKSLQRREARLSGDAPASWWGGLVATPGRGPVSGTIVATGTGRGSVSPTGAVTVALQSNVTFTITAGAWGHTDRVLLDGSSNIGAVAAYTFTNVTGDHTLDAFFATDQTTNGTPYWWLAQSNPAWTNNFEALATNDFDGDGMPTWMEWIAGTHPTNPASAFRISIALTNGSQVVVSIPTTPAGSEYEGRSRIYSLVTTSNLTQGAGSAIPGWAHLPGSGQTLHFTDTFGTNGMRFYRGRVQLE
jgi:hypothetical protein